MSTKKIFVYSIPRPTATGISDWTNDSSGKKLQKVKIGRCKDSIMALYSPKVGGLANYISYTPYIDPATGSPFLKEDGSQMMLQEYLEKKWNKPPGYFTNRAWMKGDSLKEEDFTYFQRQSWQLNDGSTVLDLSLMNDELGYYVMLASSLVANSEREWREHKWPRAQYYIALENESEELKHKKTALKLKAFKALSNNELTNIIKRKIVSILDLSSTKASLTEEQVDNILYDYIDKSTYLAGSNIDKFLDVINLLSTVTGRETFEARYILKQALELRIVYEKQDVYTWVRPAGNIVIGNRYSEAVDFLLNPAKTAELEEIQQQIKDKS